MASAQHIVLAAIATVAVQGASAQQTAPRATAEAALTTEVREADQLMHEFHASADRIDKEVWIGTMYNEIDVPEHTCYSLGMLLGYETVVRHLRFDRKWSAARTPDEAHTLRVKAQSLANFVSVVNASLKESREKRAIAWNLDCSGKYGFFHQVKGDQTFYEVVNGGRGIKILGAIEPGFTAKLTATLAATPKATFVALGSGGGSVAEAIASGRLIRSKGLKTTIWNNCYSACPLVFLGGVERHVHSPYPSLGFHQISTSAGVITKNSPVYARVADYIREMGTDEQFVINSMLRAAPQQMYMVNGADPQLCRSRTATWIQRTCSAGE